MKINAKNWNWALSGHLFEDIKLNKKDRYKYGLIQSASTMYREACEDDVSKWMSDTRNIIAKGGSLYGAKL